MFYTIYKTTNKINGNFYIGMHQTENPDDDYLGSGNLLMLAFKKYGKANFSKEVLHIFGSRGEMVNKEKELVTLELCMTESCYNIAPGGEGGAVMKTWSDEQKSVRNKKISESHKKRFANMTDEERAELSKRYSKVRRDNMESTLKTIEIMAAAKRGKTYEEIYGSEKAAELKEQRAKTASGPCPAKADHCRGRTYEEMYGPEKAAELKAARRLSSSKPRKKKSSISL